MSTPAPVLVSCEVPLAQVSPGEVGGKGWNLFRLRDLGLAVPPWHVVSSRLFDEVVEGGSDILLEVLDRTAVLDRDDLAAASRRVAEAIDAWEFPASLERELRHAFTGDHRLAVRSSAAGEDGSEHSFAGILESVLDVAPADVLAATKRVWASAVSERALLYRRRKELGAGGISTAVIVQEMVPSAVSGVLFTRDPADRGDGCVISAGLGLGEGVVSDAVESDTFRIARDSDGIVKDVRAKRFRIVPSGEDRGGTRRERVPLAARARPALSDAQVRQLRDVGLAIEGALGAPQDIEWAFDPAGRLFLLQARPIVGLGGRRQRAASNPRGKLRVWDNSNIVESYPGLTLPLTFSFARRAYEVSFRKAALGFLPCDRTLERSQHVFGSLLGLLHGRVYYNLLSWYEMFSYLPAPDHYKGSWDRMVGIAHATALPEAPVGRLTRAVSLLRAIGILLGVEANAREFSRRFDAFYSRYRDAGTGSATADEIVESYRSLEQAVAGFWHLTLYNDFCAIKYLEWLSGLCRRWGLEGQPRLEGALLCGERGVDSVAPVRSLVGLAEAIRREPVFAELLAGGDDRGIWRAIQSDERLRPLREALEAHLAAFGDRNVEELKLEAPTFRDEPWLLVGLLRRYCDDGLSVRGMEEQEARLRLSGEEVLRTHLRNPAKRLLFTFVLNSARAAIRNRENMRLARSRLFGIVRRLLRRLGDLFAEQGRLEAGRDVFYLTLDEALGFVEGTAVTQDLKALVALRKAEYAEFARREPGERLESVGLPCMASTDEAETARDVSKSLKGTGCSAGVAAGRAKVVTEPRGAVAGRGEVLVARSTDPGWVFLMIGSAGIVVERGSPLSHTAIIGRELGIPTVVGAKGATRLIPDGSAITIDGGTGDVRWS